MKINLLVVGRVVVVVVLVVLGLVVVLCVVVVCTALFKESFKYFPMYSFPYSHFTKIDDYHINNDLISVCKSLDFTIRPNTDFSKF